MQCFGLMQSAWNCCAAQQASSPDEAALVIAAKVFGFFFHYRAPAVVAVREPAPPDAAGPSLGARADVDAEYTILAVLEFNSTRKRQSVVIRQPDGSILLQCKARAAAVCVQCAYPAARTE